MFTRNRRTLDIGAQIIRFQIRSTAAGAKKQAASKNEDPKFQFVDPNELFGAEGTRFTLIHLLANLADPFDYSTHVNQLILAKQLIEHGANVNADENIQRMTPLHRACFSHVVTNLDFVEHLLEAGADPNTRDHTGLIPLM
jgi:ankyrin repeat protein